MKAYSKVCLAVFISALLPSLALAVTFDDSITLTLPSSGDQFTIDGGSVVDSLTVNSDGISFDFVGGQHLNLRSADRRKFTNSLSTAWECNSTESFINLKRDGTATTSQTVTVTPAGTCTGGGGGGGGASGGGGGGASGGGGGSAASYAPTVPVQAGIAATVPATTPASSVAQPSAVAQAVSPVFNKDLVLGGKSSDVSKLQALLASDKSLYPEGIISGYFGALTKAAVIRFQKKYGLPQVGRAGPMTRQKLAEVFGEKKAEAALPAPKPTQSSTDQIKALQDQLKTLQDQIKALQATPAPAPAAAAPAPVPAPIPVPSQQPSIPWFLQLQSAPKPQ